ncbi:MAG: BON domain-containing protein [Planctomycetaceae bacterium]
MAPNSSENDLIDHFSTRTNHAVSGLNVRLDEGHMVISGKAPSYYVKQVVTQTALAAAGTRRVRNEIDVV